MSFEKPTPEKPRDRFKIPQEYIDVIEDIGTKADADALFAEVDAVFYDVEDEAVSAERAKVVELLKSLVKPSIDNPYVERKKAEYTVAVLRNMGLPVDGYYSLLGMGIPPEIVADKMLEERENESDPYEPEDDEA